jgi:alkanesulfonate monooxygenase SsuD/methylene tetrahydromethanopterin reductase-like flavin-dependent oxidoreductase (luciferase family)
MHIGLQIPSFKMPGGTAAIRPKLKEVVTTAEEAGFYSLWVMDHYYQMGAFHLNKKGWSNSQR